jgi:hypothetical protein
MAVSKAFVSCTNSMATHTNWTCGARTGQSPPPPILNVDLLFYTETKTSAWLTDFETLFFLTSQCNETGEGAPTEHNEQTLVTLCRTLHRQHNEQTLVTLCRTLHRQHNEQTVVALRRTLHRQHNEQTVVALCRTLHRQHNEQTVVTLCRTLHRQFKCYCTGM